MLNLARYEKLFIFHNKFLRVFYISSNVPPIFWPHPRNKICWCSQRWSLFEWWYPQWSKISLCGNISWSLETVNSHWGYIQRISHMKEQFVTEFLLGLRCGVVNPSFVTIMRWRENSRLLLNNAKNGWIYAQLWGNAAPILRLAFSFPSDHS